MSRDKFCVANIILKEQLIKAIFKYYTGLTYERFLALLDFLLADSASLVYDTRHSEIHSLTKEDCLFYFMVLKTKFWIKRFVLGLVFCFKLLAVFSMLRQI